MFHSKRIKTLLGLSTLLALWILPSALVAGGKSCERGMVVFVGRDAKGVVAFALEQTYAQGDRWDWMQAQQCAWLYDERQGWVKLKGQYGATFDGNTLGKRIGGDFRPSGAPGFQSRMSLHSDANDIHLSLKADKVALNKRDAAGQLVIALGEGTFTWQQRRIVGRAYVRNQRTQDMGATELYVQNTKGMRREAIYMSVANTGFLSVLRSNERSLVPMAGELTMSLELDSIAGMAEHMQLEATKWSRMGFYEYPVEWQGSFDLGGHSAHFKLAAQSLHTTEFLLVAGSRLAWAKGFLRVDGRNYPLHGFAEVEGRLQGRKQIEEAEWRATPYVVPTVPGRSWEEVVH